MFLDDFVNPITVEEAKTDYQKMRDRQKAIDAGRPVAKPRTSKQTDYQKRRAEQRRQEELGEDSWHGESNAWNDGHDQWANEGVGPESNPMDTDSPIHGGMSETQLHVGDPVVVTAPNEFEGKTGEIAEFSPSGKFVIVNLYNHGKQSMHLSDVEYNQYADEEDDLDEDGEGTPEGLPHLTKTLLTHIVDQVGTEGAHAICKSLEWGDGAAEELLALILKDLKADISDEEIAEHIGKVKGGYRLYSHKGKNLGTFGSKAAAEKHEREVQYFKHAGESIEESLSDIDMMRQDLERMNDRQFMTAYGISKAAFQQKYRTLLKPAPQQDVPVAQGPIFKEFAPSPERDDSNDDDRVPNDLHKFANLWWNAADPEIQKYIADQLATRGWTIQQADYDHVLLKHRDGQQYVISDDTFDPDLHEGNLKEKWSQKYKRSINCAHPKGFSQKAHCAGRKKNEDAPVEEGYQDFNKVEPYEVCLAGKPVKQFDYYEDARRFHDNWKKKLYNQGEKAKADKITLNPIMKEGVAEAKPRELYRKTNDALTKQALDKAYRANPSAKNDTEALAGLLSRELNALDKEKETNQDQEQQIKSLDAKVNKISGQPTAKAAEPAKQTVMKTVVNPETGTPEKVPTTVTAKPASNVVPMPTARTARVPNVQIQAPIGLPTPAQTTAQAPAQATAPAQAQVPAQPATSPAQATAPVQAPATTTVQTPAPQQTVVPQSRDTKDIEQNLAQKFGTFSSNQPKLTPGTGPKKTNISTYKPRGADAKAARLASMLGGGQANAANGASLHEANDAGMLAFAQSNLQKLTNAYVANHPTVEIDGLGGIRPLVIKKKHIRGLVDVLDAMPDSENKRTLMINLFTNPAYLGQFIYEYVVNKGQSAPPEDPNQGVLEGDVVPFTNNQQTLQAYNDAMQIVKAAADTRVSDSSLNMMRQDFAGKYQQRYQIAQAPDRTYYLLDKQTNQRQRLPDPRTFAIESKNYWAKLQNERRVKVNNLVTELKESIKDIK